MVTDLTARGHDAQDSAQRNTFSVDGLHWLPIVTPDTFFFLFLLSSEEEEEEMKAEEQRNE